MFNKKRISVLSLMLVLLFTLSACSTESGLYKAFQKQQDIKSFTAETSFKLNLKGEKLEEDMEMLLGIVSEALKDTELVVSQKAISNEAGDKAEVEVVMTGKKADKEYPVSVWADIDMTNKEEVKMLQVVKLPEELRAMMGEELKGKDYIVYDMDSLFANEDMDLNLNQEMYSKITEWGVTAQPKLVKFAENYTKNLKLDVKKLENKKVKNQDLEIYEIALDDKGLKEIIRYSVNSLLEDETMKELGREYLDLVMEVVGESDEDLKTDLEITDEDLEEFKTKINEGLDKLEKIQILGEEGIKMQMGVNKEGFVSHEKGKMQFALNLQEIFAMTAESTLTVDGEEVEKTEEKIEGPKGKIIIELEYESNLSNINDKSLKIEKPKTTKENSIDYVELLEIQKQQQEEFLKELESMEETETLDVE